MKDFQFPGKDGTQITAYAWLPQQPVRAVLQTVHGVIEHARRYAPLAEFLNQHGIALYANDHRGHGKTAADESQLGYFADREGWSLLVEDLHQLNLKISAEHPNVPVFMLGHSMGSFLARTYITRYGESLKGCILSGTATHPLLLVHSGKLLARLQAFFKGRHYRSPLLAKMSFGAYNKKFTHPRTPFDWVSRDQRVVDAYMADPLCGFMCTCGLFIDLMSGLGFINSKASIRMTPVGLPLYLFSGSEDPVGEYGKGPQALHDRFKAHGVGDLQLRVYPEARHETLNETNREEVMGDLLTWLNARI